MDWDLFKHWLNEISNIIINECPYKKLDAVYDSMSGYYQKHKDDEND